LLDFNLIHSALYVGACPRNAIDVGLLAEIGVNIVVNLQSVDDLIENGICWSDLCDAYQQAGIIPTRLPMTDFDEQNIARHLQLAVDRLNSFLQSGSSVYLHCSAGRERSPTVAAAWLFRHAGRSKQQAGDLVVERRAVARPYRHMLDLLSRANSSNV